MLNSFDVLVFSRTILNARNVRFPVLARTAASARSVLSVAVLFNFVFFLIQLSCVFKQDRDGDMD